MKKWECTVCGYIHEGAEPPEICPVCGADRSKFVEIFSEENYESDTVSTMENSIDIDFAEMVNRMLLNGFRIVNGYGSLANKTFRIGHMGELTLSNLENMLKILTDVITELRLGS